MSGQKNIRVEDGSDVCLGWGGWGQGPSLTETLLALNYSFNFQKQELDPEWSTMRSDMKRKNVFLRFESLQSDSATFAPVMSKKLSVSNG